jgi:hypothetical protein
VWLAEEAECRDDIRVECAGTIAGRYFASPIRKGHQLIAAGWLMLAGPVDLDQLDDGIRTGSERRRGGAEPYGPTGRP